MLTQTPPISPYPVWSIDQTMQGTIQSVQRYEKIVTPADMKVRSLFGIPLTSALTNQTLPDETLQHYINEAISEVEHTLDLYITPVQFEEKHDYNKEFFAWSFAYLKLNHPNILSVQDCAISFNNDFRQPVSVDFPKEFIHIMPQEGCIQLVPATGTTLGGFVLSIFFGVQFHALRLANILDYPGAVRVTYTAGFEKDKVPALLVSLIETIAAIKTLSMLGPVLFPMNSVSVGIDGVSQSTSNPGPQYFAARLADLEKRKEQMMDAAKGYYQRQFLIDTI